MSDEIEERIDKEYEEYLKEHFRSHYANGLDTQKKELEEEGFIPNPSWGKPLSKPAFILWTVNKALGMEKKNQNKKGNE